MNDATVLPPLERPRRFNFNWVLPVLFRPRAAFAEIAGQTRGVWLTPMLILTLSALLVVAVAGPIKVAAAQSGQVELPEGFEFWTPEQQAQFFQAQQAMQGPVFNYVFPAILGVLQVWVGWLVVAGLLHLVLTMLGGRESSGGTLNLVAWASLPFAVRDLVVAAGMLATDQLLRPGLASYAPEGSGWVYGLAAEVFSRLDIYTLWFVVLLVIGVRVTVGLPLGKVLFGVLITLLVALLLAALPGVLARQLEGLNIVRPFLF